MGGEQIHCQLGQQIEMLPRSKCVAIFIVRENVVLCLYATIHGMMVNLGFQLAELIWDA